MPPIEQIWPFVQRELDRVGGDPGCLPLPVRTVWLVASAQGQIDSGGFRSFFEAGFPGDPPYFVFVEAYRRIGAEEAAACLEKAAAVFPFRNPHRYGNWRARFLSSLGEGHPFILIGDLLRGNRDVWKSLWKYIEAHKEYFKT